MDTRKYHERMEFSAIFSMCFVTILLLTEFGMYESIHDYYRISEGLIIGIGAAANSFLIFQILRLRV